MNRRGFLAGIIAACAAPAIVRSGLVMPIKPALVTAPGLFPEDNRDWERWEYWGDIDQRTLNYLQREMLDHATASAALDRFASIKPMPDSLQRTIKFIRPFPFTAVRFKLT